MTTKDETVKTTLNKFNFSRQQRWLLLLGNYIPFLHVLTLVSVFFIPGVPFVWRIVVALFLLYGVPPLLARGILSVFPTPEGRIGIPSREYFVWWYLLNLQVLYCRLPFLEEGMRLIPGAYSLWLRLWGSRIGAFTYWASGLRILDRSFLNIGDGVVFGDGVRINPHVIAENEEGQLELILGSVHIGHGALVGGYALLTGGSRIADNENTRALLVLPPFSHWKRGRRIEKGMRL